MALIQATSRASNVLCRNAHLLSAGQSKRMLHNTQTRYAITTFQMPAMSPTMTEGGISSWKKNEGEAFSAGDVLLEIETDKATIDVEAQEDGIMGKIFAPDGTKNIPVGKVIAYLAEEGDDISNLEPPKEEPPAPSPTTSELSPASPSPPPPPSTPTSNAGPSQTPPVHGAVPEHSRPLFPSVHRLLLENNISKPEDIKGTGVRGMLTKGDVLAYLGKASGPLGTFKPGPSPIEEATKAKGKGVKEAVQSLDGPSIRRLIVSSMLQASIKARNPVPPEIKSADFDSIIADYLPPSKKPSTKPATPESAPPPKPAGFLDGLC